MSRTILITGATDGIGRETAHDLAGEGHTVLIHGRNAEKLAARAQALRQAGAVVETFQADLSDLGQVAAMAREVRARQQRLNEPLDVLVNNAGVYKIADPVTPDGLDARFVVNTFAPALLTRLLLPVMPRGARVVHLSSAAQAPVNLDALAGKVRVEAMPAYAQSKLALTMWSQEFAREHPDGPLSVAVNPGSLLATNMVREGFGVSGNDISIGSDILRRAALSDEFAEASGKYYDNDSRRFAAPHAEAADHERVKAVVAAIESQIAPYIES